MAMLDGRFKVAGFRLALKNLRRFYPKQNLSSPELRKDVIIAPSHPPMTFTSSPN